jgi:predicted nuclease with TOPRIM domain
LENTKDTLTFKENELKDIKGENHRLTIVKKEFEESKKNQSAKHSEHQKQLNSAQDELKTLRVKQKEQKKELEAKSAQIEEHEKTIQLLMTNLENHETQYTVDMEALSGNLRGVQSDFLKEKSISAKQKVEIDSLQATNSRLSDKVRQLTGETENLRNRLKELEQYVEDYVEAKNHDLRILSSSKTAKKTHNPPTQVSTP